MRKQAVSFYLLLVLIPLLNLGPSLHRLSCFGLHGDSCCDISADFASHCCCDHDSNCSGAQSPRYASELSLDSSHSDCPLCRFFANYNAITSSIDRDCTEFRCCEVTQQLPQFLVCELIPDHARGPPVLSPVSFC
jgi:hypothetical protein